MEIIWVLIATFSEQYNNSMQPLNKNMKQFCDFRDQEQHHTPHTMSGKAPEKCYYMKSMTIITQVQVEYGLISAMSLWLILSFSCEVYVKVDPAADIRVVQTNITALLSLEFSYNFCSLKPDPNSISILPMGKYHSRMCMCHMKSLYLHALFMNTLCVHTVFPNNKTEGIYKVNSTGPNTKPCGTLWI